MPGDAAEAEGEIPESGADTAGESALADGMRPECKETTDACELFTGRYVDLVEACAADPTDMTMIVKYFSILGELAKMDEAFEPWDEDDMNPAELAYYLDVSRVSPRNRPVWNINICSPRRPLQRRMTALHAFAIAADPELIRPPRKIRRMAAPEASEPGDAARKDGEIAGG